MSLFKKWFGGNSGERNKEPRPEVNLEKEVNQVRKTEEENDIEPGRRIHVFAYGMLNIRFDREITNKYRITVWQGKERIYSFTIFSEPGDYEQLTEACKQIIVFLNGEQHIRDLPANDLLKGFFYGH